MKYISESLGQERKTFRRRNFGKREVQSETHNDET
jgi:hypothetical protein